MLTITFNAFSFLQNKLKANNTPFTNAPMEIPDGTTVKDLVVLLSLDPGDVEAIFVNGTVQSWHKPLKDGDRVAMVPPGTPGPYRVLLGIRNEDA